MELDWSLDVFFGRGVRLALRIRRVPAECAWSEPASAGARVEEAPSAAGPRVDGP